MGFSAEETYKRMFGIPKPTKEDYQAAAGCPTPGRRVRSGGRGRGLARGRGRGPIGRFRS